MGARGEAEGKGERESLADSLLSVTRPHDPEIMT